jgi:short subunit dehydrogenase-like uncharacterized protein
VPESDLDVVVFGATSVTGRRVAAYLAERTAGTDLTWAAAARDLDKLARVLGEEGVANAKAIAADVGDPGSLAEMASRARTVVNLVGPYTRYGAPVIEACVAQGANYVDLTGEIPFVRRMIDRFDAAARDAGVKIVQVCGFEALPPDLGVLIAGEAAWERWEERLAEVELETVVIETPPGIPRASDFISGGTMQSAAAVVGDADAAAITDPGLLIEDPVAADTVRSRSPIRLAPRRGFAGAVVAPMSPAAFINPAVIHRTAAILADDAGQPFHPFTYREGVAMPGSDATLPLRYAAAGAISGVQAGMAAAAQASAGVRERVGRAMSKVLPSSGFGPGADRIDAWRWGMNIRARTQGGNVAEVRIEAEGHPGYRATARMLGEAGLMLSEPGATPQRSGCLTPATALGSERIDRFERARLRFSVRD